MIEIDDISFKRLDHYKLHEDQQCRFTCSSDSDRDQLSPASMDHPLGSSTIAAPIKHTYASGTTLTSIHGLPVIKRKRGRPPKNKQEVSSPLPVQTGNKAQVNNA